LTLDIVHHAECPVIVVRPPDEKELRAKEYETGAGYGATTSSGATTTPGTSYGEKGYAGEGSEKPEPISLATATTTGTRTVL
jgi:hypothetical protein